MRETIRLKVINGPNLNMLGKREEGLYGYDSLEEINKGLAKAAGLHDASLIFFQSNIEGELVNAIQEAGESGAAGIIINPGAYTHSSVAIRDALLAVRLPFVEVHISNTFSREEFRHRSYISDIAAGVIIGFGPDGYNLALIGLLGKLRNTPN